jgi:hypothetical protein
MIAPPPTWNVQQSQDQPREQPRACLAPTSSPVLPSGLAPNTTAPRLLQPNEVLNETLFGFMTLSMRHEDNETVIQGWHKINNSVSRSEQALAVYVLSCFSQMLYDRQRQWFITRQHGQQQ